MKSGPQKSNVSCNPFKNNGLIIAIISRLPIEFIEAIRELDYDNIALNKVFYNTGIKERLVKAGK